MREEKELHCHQCSNHCPVSALKCGKGRRYFEKLEQKKEEDRNDIPGLMRAFGPYLQKCKCKEKRGGQARILAILHKRECVAQKELQDLLQIKAGSLSELIGKLEKKGLIQSVKDKEDRRKSMICITEEGRIKARSQVFCGKGKEVLAALSEEEQEELKVLLGKLLQSLEEHCPQGKA